MKFENTNHDLSSFDGCLALAKEADENDFVSRFSTKNSGSEFLSEDDMLNAAFSHMNEIKSIVESVVSLSKLNH